MLSLATRFVTLLAFTAHAVLGCCGHHGHAGAGASAHAGTLEQFAQQPAHTSCCASKTHRASKPAGQGSASFGGGVRHADGALGHPLPIPQHPCDDSSDCQASACAYVASDCKCLELPADGLTFGADFAPVAGYRVQAGLGMRRHASPSLCHTYAGTSGALCALLQTWQV